MGVTAGLQPGVLSQLLMSAEPALRLVSTAELWRRRGVPPAVCVGAAAGGEDGAVSSDSAYRASRRPADPERRRHLSTQYPLFHTNKNALIPYIYFPNGGHLNNRCLNPNRRLSSAAARAAALFVPSLIGHFYSGEHGALNLRCYNHREPLGKQWARRPFRCLCKSGALSTLPTHRADGDAALGADALQH